MKMKVKVKNKKEDAPEKLSKRLKMSPKNRNGLERLLKCQAKKGLKFSKKRAAIIEHFIKADRHYTVEQLYNEIKQIVPNIGYSTIYRTLKLLVDCGMARTHHFGETDARFELVHKEQHHDHLVCEKCGRIIEFTHDSIEKFQNAVAKEHNFLVKSHELQIFGVCKRCQQRKRQR